MSTGLYLTAQRKSVNFKSMKTAVEIYKLLPKTNCGKCGLTSCFGFAAKLASRQASPDECTNMTPEARDALRDADANRTDSPGTVYEQVLESLKPKIQALDFEKAALQFGVKRISPGKLELTFLNET